MISCYRCLTHSVPPINMWIVSIHFSSTNPAEKLMSQVDNCLNKCREQVFLHKQNHSRHKTQHFKYRFLENYFKRHYFSLIQKTIRTQTGGSIFEQSYLTKETEEWTKFPALQKLDCWEKRMKSILWVLCKRPNQRKHSGQYLHKELY